MNVLSIFLESASSLEGLEELAVLMEATSIVSDLISFAISIFMCIVMWRINVKAGQPGWACLIPFYSTYIDCKVAKKPKLFIPQLINGIVAFMSMIALFVSLALMFAGSISTNIVISSAWPIVSGIICTITIILAIVFNVIYCDGLSKAFGQHTGFTIGLIFLPKIFKAIMAFDSGIQYQFDDAPILNGETNFDFSGQNYNTETTFNQSSDWGNSNFN